MASSNSTALKQQADSFKRQVDASDDGSKNRGPELEKTVRTSDGDLSTLVPDTSPVTRSDINSIVGIGKQAFPAGRSAFGAK